MIVLDKLKNRISADGYFFGSYLIFSRLLRNFRSKIYGFLLNAENLDIGTGCYLKGVGYINFGSNISIFRGIWLEAVSYHNGHRFSPKIKIGDNVCFSNNVHISCINSVSIDDNVLIGSNVHISDHNHGSYTGEKCSSPEENPSLRRLVSAGAVHIQERVWIGDNVTIIGPAIIGTGTVIGSNSVVRGNIDAGTVAVGAPARMVKRYNHSSQQWEKCLNEPIEKDRINLNR